MNKVTRVRKKSRIERILITVYVCIICIVSYIACYFAYEQRQGELLSTLNMTLLRAATEYENLTQNFWSIYIPIFEQDTEDNYALQRYFVGTDDLTPMDKYELVSLLRRMSTRDNRVQWLVLYSDKRDVNYIYYTGQNTLQVMESDFPYLTDLQNKKESMEIYEEKSFSTNFGNYTGIAIAGGTPYRTGGSLLVGIDISTLENICSRNNDFEALQFDIIENGKVLYTSGENAYIPAELPALGESAILRDGTNQRYVQRDASDNHVASIYYSVDWSELSRRSHRYTPLILGIVALLVVLSAFLYAALLRMLYREVDVIRGGLEIIGQNNLDHRIQGVFRQNGFQEIANSINAMTQSLQENVQRAYEYELKQKDAEMQELQAKFNPHFLYNSLDMFRARCYQNGDEETADLIAQTAAIFRGFIGSRTFVPLREELAFSKRYLTLFRARYGEIVQILYDIDFAVLEYGVVRNIFQPLIENYFVHGIDTTRDDNYIRFRGQIRDEKTILITVEDNGAGMETEKLDELNKRLHEPITTEKESYGLKNLHQRLRLFYGEPCGLTMCSREDGGLCIELVIGRVHYDPKTEGPVESELHQ